MTKIVERWLLFKYVDGQFTPLSKPFKTRDQAEKARAKYPEREQRMIGVGVIRLQK
ncbi:MAG TPA: hypothetical protein VNZ03_00995 [Terriglobales bacterium]|jgi:hypothetical protein|nr:hypothetical protein [Terriglobales bacterium]